LNQRIEGNRNDANEADRMAAFGRRPEKLAQFETYRFWPERDEPDPCPCVGSQGQTGNGRGAAKSTRMEQTKCIAYGLSGIEG